nr:hypothetical protein [Saprospiraceae bacterium]
MMEKFFCISWWMLSLAPFLLGAVGSDDGEFFFSEEYYLQSESEIQLQAVFSDVEIQTVSTGPVSVRAAIQWDSITEFEKEELLTYFKLSFEVEGNSIQIRSFIEDAPAWWWKKINGIRDKNDRSAVRIIIQTPPYLEWTVEQDGGNLKMEEFNKPSAITISSGNLQLGSGNSSLILKMDHSEAFIENLVRAQIDMAYSSIEIQKAQILDILSSYSRLKIHRVDFFILMSSNDSIEVGVAGSVMGKSDFSKALFAFVKKFTLDGESLELRLGRIFEAVKFTGENSSITIDRVDARSRIISVKGDDNSLGVQLDPVLGMTFYYIGSLREIHIPFCGFEKLKTYEPARKVRYFEDCEGEYKFNLSFQGENGSVIARR